MPTENPTNKSNLICLGCKNNRYPHNQNCQYLRLLEIEQLNILEALRIIQQRKEDNNDSEDS